MCCSIQISPASAIKYVITNEDHSASGQYAPWRRRYKTAFFTKRYRQD